MKKYYFILIALITLTGMQGFSQVNYFNTTTDSATYSSAIGYSSIATGNVSFAGGWHSTAEGNVSFAYGDNSFAGSTNAIAMGTSANANQQYSFAIGNNVMSGMNQSPFAGQYAFCIGNESVSKGDYSMAFGRFVEAMSTNSFVIGVGYSETEKLVNANPNSLSIGFNSTKPTLFVSGATGGPNETGKVGIGVELPMEKLDVNGNILVSDVNSGLILKSPDGSLWKLTVNNYGELEIADPDKTYEINKMSNNNLYPNPTENAVNFSIDEKDIEFPVFVEIFDINGNLIYKAPFIETEININISSFSKGTYIVKIKDSTQNLIKAEKLIKK